MVDLEWSGATDEPAGSGVAGYWLLLDGVADTVPSPGPPSVFIAHGLDAHMASSEPQPAGDRWVHLLTCDHAGGCAPTHAGPFFIDTTPPGMMGSLTSPSHGVGVFSSDPVIQIAWTAAPDASGIGGYSIEFDNSATWACDETVDVAGTVFASQSPTLPEGSWYAHACAVDLVGNWGAVASLGPFPVDLTPPTGVTNLISPSHGDGLPRADATVDVDWAASNDGASGIAGYAAAFTTTQTWVCDEVIDVITASVGVTSNSLADGVWFAHVCASDNAGNWSPVVSDGPCEIASAMATVDSVMTVAATPDFRLHDGESTSVSVTQIEVAFSRTMFDPVGDNEAGDISDPGNYLLVGDGGDGLLSTTACDAGAAPSDLGINVDRSDAPDSDDWATLWINGGAPLPAGHYRLLTCGDLLAAGGSPFDGDVNGIGTDDHRLDFEILVSNLLENPNFDESLTHWIATPPTGGTTDHDPADGQWLPTSGSVVMYDDGAGAITPFEISQCVPLDSLESLDVLGKVWVGGSGSEMPSTVVTIDNFIVENCGFPPVSRAVSGELGLGRGAGWIDFTAQFSLPNRVKSARVSLVVSPGAATGFSVHFDQVFAGVVNSVIFTDDFEFGDAGAWTESVP